MLFPKTEQMLFYILSDIHYSKSSLFIERRDPVDSDFPQFHAWRFRTKPEKIVPAAMTVTGNSFCAGLMVSDKWVMRELSGPEVHESSPYEREIRSKLIYKQRLQDTMKRYLCYLCHSILYIFFTSSHSLCFPLFTFCQNQRG